MRENDNEIKLRSLVRSSCQPVLASSTFKNDLRGRVARATPSGVSGLDRVLSLNPAIWMAIGAVAAIILIIYGILAVPTPNIAMGALIPVW